MELREKYLSKKPKPILDETRSFDVNFLPMPTDAEKIEAKAYQRRLWQPENEEAADTHRDAWNALQRAQDGNIGTWRCRFCCIIVWGRSHGQLCGCCGKFLHPRESGPVV